MWFVPVEIGLTPYPVLCRPYGARFLSLSFVIGLTPYPMLCRPYGALFVVSVDVDGVGALSRAFFS